MLLSEIFEQLKYGELSTIALGGTDCAGLSVDDYPRIIAHTNLALIELYKRFTIKTGELTLVPDDIITEYRLHSDFAQSNTASGEPIKYIKDTIEVPFTDDINKIETVKDLAGRTVPLNDRKQIFSLFTPNFKTIRINYNIPTEYIPADSYNSASKPPVYMPVNREELTVLYRAKPEAIPTDILNPEMVEILLPYSLMEALLYYIASRIHTNLNLDGSIGEGNNYMQKFEQACNKVWELGLMNLDEDTNEKLDNAGWV